jgi:hypothetical protein
MAFALDEGADVIHWLERPGAQKNLVGIQNRIRISADSIAKLIQLKNDLRGTNRSVYEEAVMAEDEDLA